MVGGEGNRNICLKRPAPLCGACVLAELIVDLAVALCVTNVSLFQCHVAIVFLYGLDIFL